MHSALAMQVGKLDDARRLVAESRCRRASLRHRDPKPPSRLEARFLRIWQAIGGLTLERELLFHPGRRWRADFAHLPSRTLIEIEGGIWLRGRHTRPQGFLANIEKYFEAAMAGWRVLRLSERELTTPTVSRIVDFLARA